MKCTLCPHNCNVDRSISKGYCNSGDIPRIARANLHMWEEPCISGTEGSGTIFFTGCNLKCVYCQNRKISRGEAGKSITISELADTMIRLQDDGANNINLVTAGHYVDSVILAIDVARKLGLNIPIVYNTSSYEKVETIKSLEGYVDVYLPDFKYYDNDMAFRYSHVNNYREIATLAIDEMVRQCGNPSFDNRGIMTRGVIIRHMILPGYTKDSKKVVGYLHDRYGEQVYISIMNQYTPIDLEPRFENINRKITDEEYDEVVDYAIDIGVENGFIQEGDTADESFIPEFDIKE